MGDKKPENNMLDAPGLWGSPCGGGLVALTDVLPAPMRV